MYVCIYIYIYTYVRAFEGPLRVRGRRRLLEQLVEPLVQDAWGGIADEIGTPAPTWSPR